MKIISFSFAGGSKFSYHQFANKLPDFVVIEYPGRGMRIQEDLIRNTELLVENLFPKVIVEINESTDYIVYGHSMGALIGYLICLKIQELGLKAPLRLIVSGMQAPSIDRKNKISHLSGNSFWGEVLKMGGMPEELKKNQELINFYEPILKADFTAIENYKYIKAQQLNIPIDVLFGSEEDISHREITAWKKESNQEVTITNLQGNHFFIFNHINYLIELFSNQFTKNVKNRL